MKRLVLLTALTITGGSLMIIGAGIHNGRSDPSAGERLSPPASSRISRGPIRELSGIIKSHRYPDVYWVHNDSGDRARLFAIDGQGRLIVPDPSAQSYYGDERQSGGDSRQGVTIEQARNVDWEDITRDDEFLYIADVGNNGNARRDLAIYAVPEPDPFAQTTATAVYSYPVEYPDQTGFPDPEWDKDSESLFVWNGQLYLITKHRSSRPGRRAEPGARLYRLDTRHTDRPNVLTLVDQHDQITFATGADVSPDGGLLAVISYSDLWLFRAPEDGSDRWLSSQAIRIPLDTSVLRQVEAITWDGADSLLLGNEQRELFRLSLDELGIASR